MFILQANDVFETKEYLESWDYEGGDCVGFTYTKDPENAMKYSTLNKAWEDLRNQGFAMCFMIVEVNSG